MRRSSSSTGKRSSASSTPRVPPWCQAKSPATTPATWPTRMRLRIRIRAAKFRSGVGAADDDGADPNPRSARPRLEAPPRGELVLVLRVPEHLSGSAAHGKTSVRDDHANLAQIVVEHEIETDCGTD